MGKNIKDKKSDKRQNLIKYLIYSLEILAFGLVFYLVLFPFYPAIKYKLTSRYSRHASELNAVGGNNKAVSFPEAAYSDSARRVIIPKIGVDAPIIESKTAAYGLSKGSWRVPETSTPDQGGNTVITGHRFKYLPPNNLTFYLLDKLTVGDNFFVIWNGKNYTYKVKETKVVPATQLSIMDQTKESIVTLFTCDPIYSTKNRLVVIGELLE